jgi:hypothetical protein
MRVQYPDVASLMQATLNRYFATIRRSARTTSLLTAYTKHRPSFPFRSWSLLHLETSSAG